MSSLIDVLSLVSPVLAGVAAVAAFQRSVASARESTRAINTVESVDLRRAIQSLDRPALRHVLYSELGSVRVSDYVTNEPLRTRFDELIAEITDFVAEPEVVDDVQREEYVSPFPTRRRVPAELSKPYDDLLAGDTWAALARLRRELEQRFAEDLDEPTVGGRPSGAGAKLRRMRSLGLVDEGTYGQLNYAVVTCNAAVHGEDISISQGMEVLEIVARWLERER